MSLITPDFGLFFWMLLAFTVVFFLLRKFAWAPIMKGLQSREDSISEALSKAEQAQHEVVRLQERAKALEMESRAERMKMMAEAERAREEMLREARTMAQAEAERYREEARLTIEQEREEARKSIREEVVRVSMLVAERVLREKLQATGAQKAHMDKILDEVLSSESKD